MKTGYPSIDRTHLQGIPEEKLHPEIYPLSMLATFMKINGGHLEEVAIETNGKAYTKQMLRDDSIRVAGALLKMGLKTGDKIALVVPNCYEGIITTFGANAIGIQVVMFEPLTDSNTAQFYEELRTHRPKLALFYDKPAAWMNALKAYAPYAENFLVIDPSDTFTKRRFGFWNVIDAMGAPTEETTKEIESHSLSEKDDPMVYLKTSGSTSGKPKTLPFSNRAIFAALIYAANSTGTKTRDESVTRALCNAPYQHGYGWMPMFVNIMGGNPVILAGATAKDVAGYYKLKPSYIYGTPLTLKQFMKLTPKEADISSLTAFFCAGATIPEEEYEKGIEFFRSRGCEAEIRNNYGISEGLCIGTTSDHIPHMPGTIGKFYIGPEWLIVDEDGNEVKYGEAGEAIVSAASLCQGYFGDEKATKEAFVERDGKTWFKTGDYLSLRENGYVSFVGRQRRFFFALGVTDKVNCETIEQAIAGLEIVSQNAVVISKDDDGVDGAKAFIVLRKDVSPSQSTLQEIEDDLSKVLQDYQLPREIVFIDEIPLMESGKINYKLLETM